MSTEYHREHSFGILKENPVLVHLLGLSPVLAISTTLTNGIAMAIATVFVGVCSSLCVSLLRTQINSSWRFLYFMLIIACFTTAVDILMQWTHFPIYRELGIYVPLICCNFAILINLETVAYHNDWKNSLGKAGRLSAGYCLALILLSSSRELLANGTLLEHWELLLPGASDSAAVSETEALNNLFSFVAYQPAALILLGFLVAAWNSLNTQLMSSKPAAKQSVIPAKRERVTGKVGAKT